MKYPLVASKTALVTGCSTGIGLAAARMLRDRGWLVVPTARKDEDLERLRAEGFTPVKLDVAEASSVQHAAGQALRVFEGKIGALVNNAGFGQPGAIEDLTRDAMRHQFEVNVFGLQELTNRFVPIMRKEGRGRIVNISSCLGRVTLPFSGIYAASKFALEGMSDALRIELRGSGIAVAIVEPGPIDTAFRKNVLERAKGQLKDVESHFKARYEKQLARTGPEEKLTHIFRKPPDAVARKILHAVESPRPRIRYPVTIVACFLEFLHRFAPDTLVDWIMAQRLR